MNKPIHQQLWENIGTFAIDDPSSDFPFSKKLQKENAWSESFTSQAIDEYRKFIFLCCISPQGASPSDIIDKVWHLHLTYTHNYWINFCQSTLHKNIHHFPSKGGNDEKQKYEGLYRQTLQQYRDIFGQEPPATIWKVDTENAKALEIDIYEPSFYLKVTAGFGASALTFILLVNLFKTKGPDFLVYYFVIMAAGLLVSLVLQLHKSKRLDGIIAEYYPEKFSPFQIAGFLYGTHRAYQTALVELLKRDLISVTGNDYKLNPGPDTPANNEKNPLIAPLRRQFSPGDVFSYKQGYALIDQEKLYHPAFDQLTQLSKKVDYQKFVVPGIVLFIGFARLIQGLSRGKPVTFLVLEIGLFSIFALMIAASYSYTTLVFQKSALKWKKYNEDGRDIINNFTFLGVTAIAGFAEYAVLSSIFEMESPTKKEGLAGGDAGSGGCSSGGCGSGCGGCGGCGGGD